MTKDELATALPELTALLLSLGQVLPSRVDPELVQFIDKAAAGGIELEVLHHSLSTVAKKPNVNKFKVG